MPFFVCVTFAVMIVHFVLVEPAVPENIGAAARAIKTMGFSGLRLVNPCEFRQGKARWVAHASGEILDQAGVFKSLEEAVADMDFVVATSAKTRSVKGDHHPAEQLQKIITNKKQSISSVAIVFGREESGLTNDEMSLCHISTFVPMAASYPSLNLSQAVMLYAYLLSELNIQKNVVKPDPVGQSKFTAMNEQLTTLLSETKIAGNPNIYNRIFERLALLSDNDINLVMSVISALSEKSGANEKS